MSKMNKFQSNYIKAKAITEALEAKQNKVEQDYIESHNIINPDGSIPVYIYCIDDDAVFEKANNEIAQILTDIGIEAEHNTARETLKKAENALVAYAVSIAPAGIRQTLTDGARTDYGTKQKIIDLILKLDVSTVC